MTNGNTRNCKHSIIRWLSFHITRRRVFCYAGIFCIVNIIIAVLAFKSHYTKQRTLKLKKTEIFKQGLVEHISETEKDNELKHIRRDETTDKEKTGIFPKNNNVEPRGHSEKTNTPENKSKKLEPIQETHNTSCPINLTIHPRNTLDDIEESTCHPHVPSEESCVYTRQFFPLDPTAVKCKDQVEQPYEFCTLQEVKNPGGFAKLGVKCDVSRCYSKRGVYIEILDPATGLLKRVNVLGEVNNTLLEDTVLALAGRTREAGFPFLFVNCPGKNSPVISQLLNFLPSLPAPTEPSWNDKINLNIVLLDSISRKHFYRSLPRTVEYLRKTQRDQDPSAHVFDYELFQAVHGHTIECERALFDGLIFPQNRTNKERDESAIHLDVLYGVFKRAGYQTLFLDDLCWLGFYGIWQKYRAASWTSLQQKIKQSSIDSTAFTDASCAILQRFKVNLPFYTTPNHQVCFNGQHHHQYLFEYLARYLDAIRARPRSKPLFAYTSTHISHDNRGLRVQSLDENLAGFIATMSTKENTISLIFADHGNTYTWYQSKHKEGRLEMYHPAMFVIVPKQVAQKLGKEVMANLRTNQRRLFTLFDIREGIIGLAGYDGKTSLKPKGFFGNIANNRSCEDVQMTQDSICICQGWEVSISNATEHLALAEFAIGQLNNKMQKSLLASRKGDSIGGRILFGACRRLRVQDIGNVRTRRTGAGIRTTTMEVRVQSDGFVKQREVITVQVSYNDKATVSQMKLLSDNRLSAYGSYRKCADPEVDVRLCICQMPESETATQSPGDVVGKKAKIVSLGECLHEIRRIHRNESIIIETYEIANICAKKEFTVTLEPLVHSDIKYSTQLPVTLKLLPRTVYYAATSTTTNLARAETPVRWKIH